MVKEKILLHPTIQEIDELGDMVVISAVPQQRIHARDLVRSVEPPHALVRFSPAYSLADVLKSVATSGPVHSHQVFQQASLLLVRYQSNESAYLAYGGILPGPIFVTSGTYGLDLTDSISQRLEKLSLSSLPPPKLNEWNLAALARMAPLNLPKFVGPLRTDYAPRSPVPSMSGIDKDDERMTSQVERVRDETGSPRDDGSFLPLDPQVSSLRRPTAASPSYSFTSMPCTV